MAWRRCSYARRELGSALGEAGVERGGASVKQLRKKEGRRWWQQAAQRAALPCSRVQGMKEEREGREKEGAGQHGFDCV